MGKSGLKKICVVTHSFPRYESDYIAKFVERLLLAISHRYEIHVIYPSNMDAPRLKCEPFYRHQIPYPFWTHPMSQVSGLDYFNGIRLSANMLTKIREVVRKHDIDLIHAYWAIPSGFLASLYCRKIPLVITLPGSDIKIFSKKLLLGYTVKYALRKASRIIAVSNDLKREAINLGVEGQKISVIPVGVDTNRFRPMDKPGLRSNLGLPDGLIMLFAGNLIKMKRVDKLINVCASLSVDYNCYLVIIGRGSEEDNLKKLVREFNLVNVLFKGEISYEDMPLYMAASDVLVLASESEGLPGCVQEAMSSGIPVVTSNVGGLPEIVADGINGYLTRDTADMKERLRMLLSSPQRMKEIGANAREFAKQRLSLDMVIKQIEELYNSVLN